MLDQPINMMMHCYVQATTQISDKLLTTPNLRTLLMCVDASGVTSNTTCNDADSASCFGGSEMRLKCVMGRTAGIRLPLTCGLSSPKIRIEVKTRVLCQTKPNQAMPGLVSNAHTDPHPCPFTCLQLLACTLTKLSLPSDFLSS